MAAYKPRMVTEQAHFLNLNSFISSKLAYLNTVSFTIAGRSLSHDTVGRLGIFSTPNPSQSGRVAAIRQ